MRVLIELIRQCKNRILELILSLKEWRANCKVTRYGKSADYEGKILVLAHSLEKGMGIRKPRVGYGQKKAKRLLELIFVYLYKENNKNSFAIQEAVAILHIYFELQDSWGVEINELKALYDKVISWLGEEKRYMELSAGTVICAADNISMSEEAFKLESFFRERHSIRDYKDIVVDKDIIRKAVRMANLSPSACNRQPVKVYCTQSKSEALFLDELITGTNGFKGCIPNFAIISVNRAYFSGAEQFQWYINGGIYLAYFSLALHSLGISNCIMQWFAFYKTEKKVKKFFNIGPNEAIVAVVGFGYINYDAKYIMAQRKSVEETLVFREK